MNRSIVWSGPTFQPTGYADEVRGMVLALNAAGTPVHLIPPSIESPSNFRYSLAPNDRDVLERSLSHPVNSRFIQIQHGTIDSYGPSNPDAAYSIGRSMFETDSLPSHWVATANTLDELWVAGEFNRQTFASAGVRTPMHVVPGGIDSCVFRPDVPAMSIPGTRGTVFLSVFEWRRRKGWDVLLRAWADAFDRDSDVSLVLRTYPIGRVAGLRNVDVINRHIDEFLYAHCGGRTRADIAPIVVLGEPVASPDLPSLYNSAHAFVLPTRGEGWGRPFMESMACGVPVIATNWSAHLAFLNSENGYLIDVDGLEATDAIEMPSYAGQRWAAPSVSHLSSLLRRVHEDRAEANHLGARARRDMVNEWPWSRAADAIAVRLADIDRAISQFSIPSSYGHTGSLAVVVDCCPVAPLDAPLLMERWLATADVPADSELLASSVTWRVNHRGPRPPYHSPTFNAWRSANASSLEAGVHVTVLHPDESDAAPTPPLYGAWIVDVGDTIAGHVPPSLVTTLRDRADLVVVPHAAALALCRNAGVSENRLMIITPSVDDACFKYRAAFRTLAEAETRFLLLVNDEAIHDLNTAVKAYDRTFTADDDVVLRIVRSDRANAPSAHAWHQQLAAQIETARRHPRLPRIVVETVAVLAEEIPALFNATDILIYPGTGTGRSLYHAMASGTPAIAVSDAIARELLPSDCGWHVPTDAVGRVEFPALQEALRQATNLQQRAGRTNAMRARVAQWPSISAHRTLMRSVIRTAREIESPRAAGDAAPSDTEPFVLDGARQVVILAHAEWHAGVPQAIVRAYATAFSARDDVTLALCLDPAQGVSVDHAAAMIAHAIELAGCSQETTPDLLLVPDRLNEEVLHALRAASHAVVALRDDRAALHAKRAGRSVIESLSPEAWRAAVRGYVATVHEATFLAVADAHDDRRLLAR